MTCYRALLIICLSLTITILRATADKIEFENEFVEDYDNDFYNGHSKCDHDHVSHHPEIAEVAEDNYPPHEDGRLLASTTYPQLRIYPYYDILSESAPASYANYIENSLAPSVHSFLQAALKIKYPVSGNLKVSNYQTTLCGVKTPSILFGSGVRADLFIFYDSEYDSASSWVAQSSVCHLASGSNRPLIVTTKFNRALLKDPAGNVLIQEKNVYLLLHEITHNLGFSTSLYPYFLDSNGKRRAGHILSEKLNGINTVVLNTPSLIQRARKYFGCSSLAGVYMENDGAEGTAGSHFERRHFPYEYMASGLIFQQRISQFTLALLEDSGWYVPDYSFAEPYYFGQGEGCGFLFNSCSSLSFKHDEFCAGSGRGCTFQGRGGGICQSDPRSDGCKYYMPNELFDCENPNAANYARLPNIQKFGRTSGSKCFDGSLASTAYSATDTSFCFTYSCQGTENETTVKINVGKMVVTCRREGAVTIPGYYGTVQCPDPLSFCSTVGKGYCPRNCMGRGKCVNNKCVCNNGFKGIDCGLKA